MRIGITGSVASGKTTLSKRLQKRLNERFNDNFFKVIELKNFAFSNKIGFCDELQTLDFDIEKTVLDIIKFLYEHKCDNLILESHFTEDIPSNELDYLFVLEKDLKELKKIYQKRKYNEQKVYDNLQAEIFKVSYFDALGNGYEDGKNLFLINNNEDLDSAVDRMIEIIFSNKCIK